MRNPLRRRTRALAHVLPDTTSWQLLDATDPPGLPARWRGVPGPWRQHGQPMHGLYTRCADDAGLLDQLDGMAVLHGWRCGYWRGPAALASWSSPLVSYWNPLLAQGDGRLSMRWDLDHDEWTAEGVLYGWKPYGYLSCSRRYAGKVRDMAADAPFDIEVSEYRRGGISLARTESLAELYAGRLLSLVEAYGRVLPDDVWESEVLPISGHGMSKAPADYLDDAWIELETGPLAIMGLVLGYPPLVTAGWLQRPASMWVERGSLPGRQSRRRDRAADNAAADAVAVGGAR